MRLSLRFITQTHFATLSCSSKGGYFFQLFPYKSKIKKHFSTFYRYSLLFFAKNLGIYLENSVKKCILPQDQVSKRFATLKCSVTPSHNFGRYLLHHGIIAEKVLFQYNLLSTWLLQTNS